jgi:hypothetical protein
MVATAANRVQNIKGLRHHFGHALPIVLIAFSSEVYNGSREENALKHRIRASVLIQSEPIRLYMIAWLDELRTACGAASML